MQGAGCRILGVGSGQSVLERVQGAGHRILGAESRQSVGRRVQGVGFSMLGVGGGQSVGCRVQAVDKTSLRLLNCTPPTLQGPPTPLINMSQVQFVVMSQVGAGIVASC